MNIHIASQATQASIHSGLNGHMEAAVLDSIVNAGEWVACSATHCLSGKDIWDMSRGVTGAFISFERDVCERKKWLQEKKEY